MKVYNKNDVDVTFSGSFMDLEQLTSFDAIPLDRVKQARKEIEQNAYPIVHGVNNHDMGMTLDGIFQVLDRLIAESEDKE